MKDKFRYFIMTMVMFIAAINYIDRGAIAFAQAEIIKEYGFDLKSWGNVLGYFGYGYCLGALFGGALADKKGPKFVWMLCSIAWSICVVATAWAGELGIAVLGGSALFGFAVVRICFGLAEGPVYVTMTRTMANWSGPKEKGLMMGIGLLGTPLGALISAPISVLLITWTGDWKWMFVILGCLGLIWALIWAKIFTNYPEVHPRVSEEELAEIRAGAQLESMKKVEQVSVPWYKFFKYPTLVYNSIAFFAMSYIMFLILTWGPKYLQDVFNISLKDMGWVGMIPWILPCLTIVWGGRISDNLLRKTGSLRIARSYLAAGTLFLSATCFAAIPFMSSPAAIVALISLGNGFNAFVNSIVWAVVVDTVPNKVGTFGGMTHSFAITTSFIAPTVTGIIVSSYGYPAMFIAAAGIGFIGAICAFLSKPGVQEEI